ncbi:DsbA family oxidoreductase [Natronomonas sp.]|uniref:DsbA family oxidoreductase n=2 Tax=Natronomonas sp. TaxID=2184060 RepID=UPI002FC327E8
MSESQQTPTVEVYADYVCPFCYLGYASLEQYRETREEPLETDWHPFDLRAGKRSVDGSIDHSVDDGKDEEYFEEARRNVERLAEKYDVEMAQQLRKDVDSMDAQRVAWRARNEYPDAFEAFHRGVFDALWEDGRDIGDVDVLKDLASEAGIPESFVEETLADESSEADLQTAFRNAQQTGITGVPTFVSEDDHAARGAVPPEQLRRLVEGA